ncbi:unnamed protein product [Tuwongella immobilis]|uniref:Uncharacterized protein n=1 Tax=Tuwongella immobilis TaxID=692036 RepID=A0A6C2YL58_9BACT|nr:unnamed protein product [Tuwongella immobilis]VTS00210.1 unnamed protein product [Tuwongella immobilis]
MLPMFLSVERIVLGHGLAICSPESDGECVGTRSPAAVRVDGCSECQLRLILFDRVGFSPFFVGLERRFAGFVFRESGVDPAFERPVL